jgi:hypothetical protein
LNVPGKMYSSSPATASRRVVRLELKFELYRLPFLPSFTCLPVGRQDIWPRGLAHIDVFDKSGTGGPSLGEFRLLTSNIIKLDRTK